MDVITALTDNIVLSETALYPILCGARYVLTVMASCRTIQQGGKEGNCVGKLSNGMLESGAHIILLVFPSGLESMFAYSLVSH